MTLSEEMIHVISVRKLFSFILASALLATLAGCQRGEDLVTITGTVVEGGQPITLPGTDPEVVEEMGFLPLEVELWPVNSAGEIDLERKPFGGSVEPDGAFFVGGDMGEGIPAGKYRVALLYMPDSDLGAGEDPGGAAHLAPWGDAFSQEKSPWVYDFTEDQEITLDVAKSS